MKSTPLGFLARPGVLFRFCLFLSAILMLIGHWAVMSSGSFFDIKRQLHYDPVTRWVSDFAAKSPEGIFIKASILFFCIALALFFSLVIAGFSGGRFAGALKFWWLVVATLMIGGLLLVIFFDMSAPQYKLQEPSWLGKRFGFGTEYLEVRPDQAEWSKRGHHQLGFQLFVAGFFFAGISLAAAEWRRGLRESIPTTAFLLLLAAVFSFWLFASQTTIAGMPQRALLLLIFFWVARNEWALRRGLTAIRSLPT